MVTNYERIKSMSIEEMAESIKEKLPIDCCLLCIGCPDEEFETNCKKYIKQWLQSESENDENR